MKLEHDHGKAAIAKRFAAGHKPFYLSDFIYGGIDGSITTFAIVAGVVGAALSSNVILILGLANLLADGFSMAASNYSGTKARLDDLARLRKVEDRHTELDPAGEAEEVRQILAQKSLKGETLDEAVASITSDKKTWIDFMLVEEYGLSLNQPSPLTAGLTTFSAFLICGAIPLLPFLLNMKSAFLVSAGMTAAVFFSIGAVKSKWATTSWWRSGIETFLIGGAAAIIAYTIGHLLRNIYQI